MLYDAKCQHEVFQADQNIVLRLQSQSQLEQLVELFRGQQARYPVTQQIKQQVDKISSSVQETFTCEEYEQFGFYGDVLQFCRCCLVLGEEKVPGKALVCRTHFLFVGRQRGAKVVVVRRLSGFSQAPAFSEQGGENRLTLYGGLLARPGADGALNARLDNRFEYKLAPAAQAGADADEHAQRCLAELRRAAEAAEARVAAAAAAGDARFVADAAVSVENVSEAFRAVLYDLVQQSLGLRCSSQALGRPSAAACFPAVYQRTLLRHQARGHAWERFLLVVHGYGVYLYQNGLAPRPLAQFSFDRLHAARAFVDEELCEVEYRDLKRQLQRQQPPHLVAEDSADVGCEYAQNDARLLASEDERRNAVQSFLAQHRLNRELIFKNILQYNNIRQVVALVLVSNPQFDQNVYNLQFDFSESESDPHDPRDVEREVEFFISAERTEDLQELYEILQFQLDNYQRYVDAINERCVTNVHLGERPGGRRTAPQDSQLTIVTDSTYRIKKSKAYKNLHI